MPIRHHSEPEPEPEPGRQEREREREQGQEQEQARAREQAQNRRPERVPGPVRERCAAETGSEAAGARSPVQCGSAGAQVPEPAQVPVPVPVPRQRGCCSSEQWAAERPRLSTGREGRR